MENAQQTLEKIHELLDFDKSSATAVAYGITKDTDNNLVYKIIGEGLDVYDLIESINDDKSQMNSNYVTLKTTGWAAPLNSKGEVEGAPSEHPERKRVRLFVSVDIDNKEVLGSSLEFEGENEIIYDLNSATGSLQMAIVSLVE